MTSFRNISIDHSGEIASGIKKSYLNFLTIPAFGLKASDLFNSKVLKGQEQIYSP